MREAHLAPSVATFSVGSRSQPLLQLEFVLCESRASIEPPRRMIAALDAKPQGGTPASRRVRFRALKQGPPIALAPMVRQDYQVIHVPEGRRVIIGRIRATCPQHADEPYHP